MSILLLTISNDEFYRRWMEMKEEPDNLDYLHPVRGVTIGNNHQR
ncbi:hypothetical protein ACU6DH_003258 [Escherichia coli]|nr:hypothetical protein [Escherichia coli]MED9342481.1 hypothetical protein [Escherichia marmotae]MCV9097733.1 hypothetical protein [Escherichia coli]MCW3223052.1 hypothetical protein [Escherichia coli]MCW3442559.1 hypothetical protein [Escherichia coli]MDM7496670.1 hypothetical protein [Escherichia coli]